MSEPSFHILFLCNGSWGLSATAAAILNDCSDGSMFALSASLDAPGPIDPLSLDVLRRFGHDIVSYESTNWKSFLRERTKLDAVITLSDRDVATKPRWPQEPVLAHWATPEPAGTGSSNLEECLVAIYRNLELRIELLMTLPVASLGQKKLAASMDAIGVFYSF